MTALERLARRRRAFVSLTVLVLAGPVGACEAVLGIGDYSDRVVDSGAGSSADGTASDGASSDGSAGDGATDGSAEGSVVRSPPSCTDLSATCGGGSSDCCASSVVPAGSYLRILEEADAANPGDAGATVSDFRLDTYEITVGRFRNFVAAYSQTMIAATAGKNPNNADDPGWDTTWNQSLPLTAGALTEALKCDATYATWTDDVGGNETRPINCVTWFEAEAFCTWDGGRLPTEAEWQYAAGGGSDNRTYPWGTTVPGPDANLAAYGCFYNGAGTCTSLANIATVGSISAGNAKWGQADMAGNVFEWVQDWYATPYPSTCVNCSDLESATFRVVRGGAFYYDATYMPAAYRNGFRGPANRYYSGGARCARAP